MYQTIDFVEGGYRYIPSVFRYSGGVAALPGYQVVRVTLASPLPVSAGFDFIAQRLKEIARPLQSFCACELRSPGQFSEQGFRAFNETYVATLRDWGIMDDAPVNPVARSNVCPEINGPREPVFHAFAYTVPTQSELPTGIIAGSGEAREPQSANETYRDTIVRYGETSDDAIKDKAQFVVEEMGRRLSALDLDWHDTTAVQVYTVYNYHGSAAAMARDGVGRAGLTWHFARPPVQGLEFEMDCRVVHNELVQSA